MTDEKKLFEAEIAYTQHAGTLMVILRLPTHDVIVGVLNPDRSRDVEDAKTAIDWISENSERLKRGDFTPEELQSLCHNRTVADGFECFARGCSDYQKQLFGKTDRDDLADLMSLLEKNQGRWCFKSLSEDGGKFDAIIERIAEKLK